MTDPPDNAPWRGQHPVPPPTPPHPTAEIPATMVTGQPTWWARLSPAPKAALIITAALLPVLLLCGGLVTVSLLAGDPEGDGAPLPAAAGSPSVSPPQPSPTASPSPTIEIRTVTETEEIPFTQETVEDSSLPKGTQEVRTDGVPGVKTLTYEVTYINGVETDRELVDEEVTTEPVTRVVAIGTYEKPEPEPEPEPSCDPNYAGACVPIASDVDCEGGSGNGPAYVKGPVRVIGTDIYDLDRDGDGIGCDS